MGLRLLMNWGMLVEEGGRFGVEMGNVVVNMMDFVVDIMVMVEENLVGLVYM